MLSKFHRDIVDFVVNEILEVFFELPKKDALVALTALINLSIMSKEASDYPPLPEIFEDPTYQKIQSQLKSLSEIMYNRQPQGNPKYSDDQSPDVNYGKFGLRTGQGESVAAEAVHQYMRYKFALTAYGVTAFDTVPSLISDKNKNPYYKYLYYKYFTEWVRQSLSEPIPGVMNTIIKEVTANVVQTVLVEKSLAPFRPYALSVNSEEIINYLCSLSPTLFEPDMAPCLEALFYEKLTNDSYQSVQKKLQNQINNGGGKFSHLEAVCLDFMTVTKAHKALMSYGNIIRSHDDTLVNKMDAICQHYVSHLQNNDADKQMPLGEADAILLKQFLSQADEFSNEKKLNEWIGNFFAVYFTSQQDGKDSLQMKIFNLALSQDKLFIVNDEWLEKFSRENMKILGNEVEITLTPYQVNRILLHALTTPIEKWSPSYHAMFDQILNLLNDANSLLFSIQALKRDSYPPELMKQLNWLSNLYEMHVNNRGKTGDQPIQVFPMLYYPKNVEDFCKILKRLSAKKIDTVLESIQNKILSNLIVDINDLKNLKEILPLRKWNSFVESLDNKFLNAFLPIADTRFRTNEIRYLKRQVADFLEKLVGFLRECKQIFPQEKWNSILKYSDWDHFGNIFGNINIWHDISIPSSLFLLGILPQNKFDYQSRYVELIKFLTHLHEINSLDNLKYYEILKDMPQNRRNILLKNEIIKAKDLHFPGQSGRARYGEKWLEIISTLDNEFLNHLITSDYSPITSLKIVITALPLERKNNFIASLDDLFLKSLIQSSSALRCPSEFPEERWLKIISAFDNEFLKSLISSSDYSRYSSLENVITALPLERKNNFISSLDDLFLKTLIRSSFDLRCPSRFPEERWHPILELLSDKDLKQLFVCENYVRECLKRFKDYLPSIKQSHFLGTLSQIPDECSNLQFIKEGVKACHSLDHADTEIQKNMLFCIMNVYSCDLLSRASEYNPTLLGVALPLDWGVSKTDKLDAVGDLLRVLSNQTSVPEVYQQHQKALDQGTLGEIYSVLKTINDRDILLNERKKSTHYQPGKK